MTSTKPDAFDAWSVANGEPVTELIDGDECIVVTRRRHGTSRVLALDSLAEQLIRTPALRSLISEGRTPETFAHAARIASLTVSEIVLRAIEMTR